MRRVPDFVRHRRARLGLLVLFALLSLGLGLALLWLDPGPGQQLIAVAGLFLSLAALVVSVIALLPSPPPRDAAELGDYLAATVREQWEEEVSARRLRDPRVIPLTWSATQRPVAAPPETVIDPIATRIVRLSLDGRLAGNFDVAAQRLAEGFAQVPSRRLVVLGEPGAGKTVLAAMLTLGLLTAREPRAQVPVLLSVSTWDPVTEPLGEWIVRSLATAYYGGQPDLPRRLLDRQLLLPILDGLDEMPEVARRNAVHAINDACDDGQGVVVTCRSVEYQDVIEGGSPLLRRAPVVEVAPVPVPDVLAYLREVNWPPDVDWEPIYTHLEAHPEGPLAGALSTPLALSSARTVYRTAERAPAELLGYDSRHAIEDHLVDQLIPAAYASGSRARPYADGAWRQQAERAERYLTYLAVYLHRHRERDLAWWLMSSRLLSRWTGIILGIATGLLMMLAVAATMHFAQPKKDPLEPSVYISITVAVLAMLAWYGPADRTPGRLSFSRRGSLERLRRGALTGLRLALLSLVPIMLTAAAAISLNRGWSQDNIVNYCRFLSFEAGVTVAVSAAFGVHGWLDAPPEQSVNASPLGLLHRDRASSLLGALAAGVMLAVLSGPLMFISLYVAYVAFLALSRGAHNTVPSGTWAAFTDSSGPVFGGVLETLAFTLLPGVVCAVLILLTRAWGRFTLLRLTLAVKGVLPWRVNQFLADARNRQLLRQSAGAYQFRHIRLQERLATRPLPSTRLSPVRTLRHRRVLALASACVLVLSVLAVRHALPRDKSTVVIMTGDIDTMYFAPASYHTLVTLNYDEAAGSFRVRWWNTRNGEEVEAQTVDPPGNLLGNDDPNTREVIREPIHSAPAQEGLWVVAFPAEPGRRTSTYIIPWDGDRAHVRKRTAYKSELPPAYEAYDVVAYSLSRKAEFTGNREAFSRAFRVGDILWGVRDLRTGKRRGRYLRVNHPIGSIREPMIVNADGTRVAVGDGDTSVYDVDTGHEICSPVPEAYSEPASMDRAGTRLAVIEETAVHVIPIHGGRCGPDRVLHPVIGGSPQVDDAALNWDGSTLATAYGDTVRLWDLSDLRS